jgi:NO-binding membrane sensor protein with MHYT domain
LFVSDLIARAGFFVMLSLLLGVEGSPIFQSSYWLWFTAFVGLNLFQSSFTGFCPAAMIFKAMGLKEK